MKTKTLVKRRFLSLSLMLVISLVSCGQTTKFKTKDNYLQMQYSKEMKYEEAEVNNNKTYSFFYDQKNFIIIAKEFLGKDTPEMSLDILRKNVSNYSRPFTDQGFTVDYEDLFKINDTQIYKFVLTNGTYDVTYLQWYDIGQDDSYLYKIMYVYDKEHEEAIENAIFSLSISPKN